MFSLDQTLLVACPNDARAILPSGGIKVLRGEPLPNG